MSFKIESEGLGYKQDSTDGKIFYYYCIGPGTGDVLCEEVSDLDEIK